MGDRAKAQELSDQAIKYLPNDEELLGSARTFRERSFARQTLAKLTFCRIAKAPTRGQVDPTSQTQHINEAVFCRLRHGLVLALLLTQLTNG